MRAISHIVLLASLAATALAAAAAARPSLQGACAVWDLHIVSLIEEVGAVEPTSVRLAAAAELLMQARAACRDENVKAMQLYEAIDLSPPARGTQPMFGLY
jgi:hypothetical protein